MHDASGDLKVQLNTPVEDIHSPEQAFVAGSIAVIGAITVYAVAALLIFRFYNPDTSPIHELAARLAVASPAVFHPEPKEKLLFLSGLLIMPLSLIPFYLLLRKAVLIPSATMSRVLFSLTVLVAVAAVAVLSFLAFGAPNPFHADAMNSHDIVARTNFEFFFLDTFLGEYFPVYVILIFPVMLVALLRREQPQILSPAREKIVSLLLHTACLGLIGLTVLINTFRFPYSFENKYDFNAVYYSVVQVFFGAPLLVEGFTNTYGLYPHFIVPLLKLTGLSVTSFSCTMALLIAIAFLLLFMFLKRVVAHRAIVFCCFCSVLFYTHFFHKIATPYDSAFAGQPIRIIFPFLALYLGTVVVASRSLRTVSGALLALAAGVLWNAEFGVVTYLAFVLFLLYREAGGKDRTAMWRRIGFHLVAATGAICLVIGCYVIGIRLFYGQYPALPHLFSTLKMFSVLGLNMLPMPLLHPWNLIALLYLIGLAKPLFALLERKVTPEDGFIFLVTLLGIGSFSYYQGRSHNWNLLMTLPYALLLTALLAQTTLGAARKGAVYGIPFALLIFVLGGGVFQLAYAAPRIAALVTDTDNRIRNLPEQRKIESNAAFIAENCDEGEQVVILSPNHHQSLYYGLSRTRAAINPGMMDLFWRADYDRLIDFLVTSGNTKLFIDLDGVPSPDGRLPEVLSVLYVLKSSNGSMAFLERRKEI